jgi:hypothetical protein
MIENITLVTVTMNAGKDMPGSCLPYALLKHYPHFKNIIIVDGSLSKESKEYYSVFPNVKVIDNPWKESLLEQLKLAASNIDDDKWFLMIDDDEFLGDALIDVLKKVDRSDSLNKLTDIIIPRLTFIKTDSSGFYSMDTPTNDYNLPIKDINLGRRCLFKVKDLKYHHAYGRHVVPYHDNPLIGGVPYGHVHLKTPELYIINDCLKSRIDPIHERLTEKQAKEYLYLLDKEGIDSTKTYKESVYKGTWSKDLKDWAIEHRNINTPVSRPYMWYFLIHNQDQNPDASFTKSKAIDMILNDTWKQNLISSRKEKALDIPVTSYETLK